VGGAEGEGGRSRRRKEELVTKKTMGGEEGLTARRRTNRSCEEVDDRRKTKPRGRDRGSFDFTFSRHRSSTALQVTQPGWMDGYLS
jgi:hypothetical protein